MSAGRRVRVLVVEDDAEMRRSYRRFFDSPDAATFETEIVADGEQAIARLKEADWDLLVLDWGLPGISGTSLLRALRAQRRMRALGVLMVTGRGSVPETVAALDAGADDHLAKPFENRLLLARLKSLARRQDLWLSEELERRLPGLTLDPEAESVLQDGREVALRRKEFGLLSIFLRRPRVLHARRFLWDTVWGYESEGWEHVLDAAISSLRRKLGPRWGGLIRAHRGQGYSFDA
jgi:DNA-binding response OmpR family regulator